MSSLARMSAWERWEMAAVSARAPLGTASAAPLTPGRTPDAASSANLALQANAQHVVQAELAQQRQAALQAGHAEGYAQGLALGHAQGLAAAQAHAELALEVQAAPLRALAASLPPAVLAAQHAIAQDLLNLALTLAQQVLGQSLALAPEGVLAAVRELLQAEPAMSGHPKLLLHPDDALLVKDHLADELHAAGWSLRADAQIARGGCRVLAASGELDATLPTRWALVAARLQLGQTHA